MRTVKWLREELARFPDDAVCFAYEGEGTGIVIERAGRSCREQGFIPCSEGDDAGKVSELLPETGKG